MTYSREEKIKSLFTLMEFSLIIPEEMKLTIKREKSLLLPIQKQRLFLTLN
jgi:hypothetical protein